MGNQLTIKGGGITQAAVQGLIDASIADVKQYRVPLPGRMMNTSIDDIAGFDSYFSGLGTASLTAGEYVLQSGANAGGKATGYKIADAAAEVETWSYKKEFKANVFVQSLGDNVMDFFLNWGTKLIENHFGFQISGGYLQGTSGNQTTQSTVNLVSLGAGAFVYAWILKAIFYPGVKCEFYVDGVLLGTITTNIPAGVDNAHQYLYIRSANGASANNKLVKLSHYSAFSES